LSGFGKVLSVSLSLLSESVIVVIAFYTLLSKSSVVESSLHTSRHIPSGMGAEDGRLLGEKRDREDPGLSKSAALGAHRKRLTARPPERVPSAAPIPSTFFPLILNKQ